jgi:hypothetical protein
MRSSSFRSFPARFLGTAATTLLGLLFWTGRVQAGEAYFLLMFAAQRTPNLPSDSHSFASFVRASWPDEGPCPRAPCLEVYTISWFPAKLPVRAYALLPECGRNFGLEETLQYVLASHARVSLWGPYPIDADLYRRAARQVTLLTSGQVAYKMIDTGYCSDGVSNCIHALSGLCGGPAVHVFSPGWGDAASCAVVVQMRPWILDCCHVYLWIVSALGLERYPIVYRAWPG